MEDEQPGAALRAAAFIGVQRPPSNGAPAPAASHVPAAPLTTPSAAPPGRMLRGGATPSGPGAGPLRGAPRSTTPKYAWGDAAPASGCSTPVSVLAASTAGALRAEAPGTRGPELAAGAPLETKAGGTSVSGGLPLASARRLGKIPSILSDSRGSLPAAGLQPREGAEDDEEDEEDEEDNQGDAEFRLRAAEAQAMASWEPASPVASDAPGGTCLDESSFFFRRLRLAPQRADSDSQRHALAMAPIPAGRGSLKARIVRTKGQGLFSGPRFFMYTETDGRSQPVFLACAARTAAQRGSVKPYYVLSSSPYEQCFNRSSPHFLARLSGSLLCTQYTLHGRGRDPEQVGGSEKGKLREELLAARFKKPTDAPRTMEVVIPRLRADGSRQELRPRRPRQEGLERAWADEALEAEDSSSRTGASSEADIFQCLTSPLAVWDPIRKVYSMNFHGRVSRASAKNFQLIPAHRGFQPDSGNGMSMQFGRVDDDTFSLDVAHPLSPVQAFALALSMFDHRPAETLRLYY